MVRGQVLHQDKGHAGLGVGGHGGKEGFKGRQSPGRSADADDGKGSLWHTRHGTLARLFIWRAQSLFPHLRRVVLSHNAFPPLCAGAVACNSLVSETMHIIPRLTRKRKWLPSGTV